MTLTFNPHRTLATVARHAKPQAPAAEPRPSKERRRVKDSFKSRAIAGAYPTPPKGLWYRLKVKFLDFICNIDFPSAKINRMTADEAYQARVLMRPGDILLRRTEGTSGNFFNPSYWKHAGVYTGNGKIVEATFKGVQETTVKEFFEHGDHVVILRPKDTSVKDRKAIVRAAEAQVGKEYDFDFDFNDPTRVSCTELASHVLKTGTGKEYVPQNWMGAVTGDGFLNSDKFSLIYKRE